MILMPLLTNTIDKNISVMKWQLFYSFFDQLINILCTNSSLFTSLYHEQLKQMGAVEMCFVFATRIAGGALINKQGYGK
ncbi:Transcription initiation factor TFIID subunit 1-like [Dirofilaria immitis]